MSKPETARQRDRIEVTPIDDERYGRGVRISGKSTDLMAVGRDITHSAKRQQEEVAKRHLHRPRRGDSLQIKPIG